MLRDDLILRTKLSPPRLHRRVLPRPMLTAQLHEAIDYRLTLVHAGTGYGKSTALAALADDGVPLYWYTLDESDADPQRFLSYLIAAFRSQLPHLSDSPHALLQEISGDGSGAAWSQTIDTLVNALADALHEPSLLVIDDYQFVANSLEVNTLAERFLAYLPSALHVIVAGRYPLNMPSLIAWRAKGEVLEFGRDDLAFRPDEIKLLFDDAYGMQLSSEEVTALSDKTEGWPIALQLVWQGLRSNAARSIADVLAQGPASLSALFDYLARDVLDRQPPEVAKFLRDTACLRELFPAACESVTQADGATMLDRLHELDLSVVALGERHYRYHHLFHDFLREQSALDPDDLRHAARFFQAGNNVEEAIYHWLAAQSFSETATAIESAGEAALRSGRLDTVANWIDALPPEALAAHPLLQAYLGDVYRLRSRFEEALAWYAEAEQTWRARNDPAGISRALRGQALVYLDTVRPAQAESLLEEALRLTDGMADRKARARLLELMAENKLNLGKPDEAERLQAEARALREEGPGEDVVGVRVKLRTGRLDEAQHILESWIEAERSAVDRGTPHPPRAHRETVLLLSFIHSMRGNAGRAFELAQEGIELGARLGSPFVTAVAHMRLGHAWQLSDREGVRDEAIRCYQNAIALGDQLAVRRTRVEAMWGLTRAYGFLGRGDPASAQRAAAEGIEIGRWAGDLWVVASVEATLGASHVLAGQSAEAIEILSRALSSFRECGDRFGRAAVRLWLCLAYLDLRQMDRFAACADELLALCEAHGYEFLFTRPSLLGPPDPRRLVPVLIEARSRRCRPAYAARLLAEIGLPDIKVHPGYQLRVQTLGAFRVWRGTVELGPRDWQRDKARQLFQLLLIHRGQWLHRDEIADRLWPNLSPDAASRDFKVALNALNKAIEPNRSADDPFAFIVRDGSAYQLRPEADLWLDAVEFEQECEAGLRLSDDAPLIDEAVHHLQTALRLYNGDYLPEAIYEDWSSDERERLLSLYLRAADKLAGLLIDRGSYNEALDVCQLILARDACWERAYRLMMTAYARQGNRPLALRTYQRCANVLKAELNVDPSPITVTLYARIAQAQ